MSQPIQTNKPKVTPNGTYYSGMTEDEAKTKKVYNKIFGLDFQDIDIDKDKTLSVFEIEEACKKQAKRTKITFKNTIKEVNSTFLKSIFLLNLAVGYKTYNTKKTQGNKSKIEQIAK